jgi:dipeptidyl aminopeptidase/acylaminoacyl peptidase
MGGGVALNAVVARPGLVDAVVLYSPVSSRAADNYRRWVRGRGALDQKVRAAFGRPADNPRFWARASARRYSHRVDVPVQVHHGTADEVCPIAWSRATVAALRRAGQAVEFHRYRGEEHRFHDGWPAMAVRMADFFDQHV